MFSVRSLTTQLSQSHADFGPPCPAVCIAITLPLISALDGATLQSRTAKDLTEELPLQTHPPPVRPDGDRWRIEFHPLNGHDRRSRRIVHEKPLTLRPSRSLIVVLTVAKQRQRIANFFRSHRKNSYCTEHFSDLRTIALLFADRSTIDRNHTRTMTNR